MVSEATKDILDVTGGFSLEKTEDDVSVYI